MKSADFFFNSRLKFQKFLATSVVVIQADLCFEKLHKGFRL